MLVEFLYDFLDAMGPSYAPLFVHKLTTTNILSKELVSPKNSIIDISFVLIYLLLCAWIILFFFLTTNLLILFIFFRRWPKMCFKALLYLALGQSTYTWCCNKIIVSVPTPLQKTAGWQSEVDGMFSFKTMVSQLGWMWSWHSRCFQECWACSSLHFPKNFTSLQPS